MLANLQRRRSRTYLQCPATRHNIHELVFKRERERERADLWGRWPCVVPIFRLLQRLKYEFITSSCRQSIPLSITRTRLDNLTIIVQPTWTINYLTNYQAFFPHSYRPSCHSPKSCSTANHPKRARYRPAYEAFLWQASRDTCFLPSHIHSEATTSNSFEI